MNANENNTSVNNENNTTNFEESIKEALREGQEIVESSREISESINNFSKGSNKAFDLSPNSPAKQTIQSYIQKVQVITDKVDNRLKFVEYTLEYINNGDMIQVLLKLGKETLEDFAFKKGLEISKDIALIVMKSVPKGKTPLGIVIFTAGGIVSYFFADEIEDLAKELFFNKNNIFYRIDKAIEQFFAPPMKCPKGSEWPTGGCQGFDVIFNQMQTTLGKSLFTPHPYPSYSKEYEFALAKKKELADKTSIASKTYSFMDEEYLKNIQDLQEQEQIINQEEQKYQLALKFYKEDNKIKNEIFNSLFKTLNENLSFQLKQERNTFLNPNQSLSIIATKKYSLKTLNLQDIDNINIDSEFAYLRALFLCESFLVLDNNSEALLNEKMAKETLEYDEDEYILFILHKSKLNDTYLKARKELYKSINEFKKLGFKDLENAYQAYINSLIVNEEIDKDETINKNENLNQESDIKENTSSTKEQDFNLLSSHSKNLNHFILENKDKNKRIIFLNNASSMSNLIHIYDNHCDVFIKNESLLDIKRIEKEYDIKFKEFNTRVFFYEKLLLGAKENNEFSFEDKEENSLYHFKYDKEDLNSLGDLSIKYNNYNARIKNYSLLEESLNIKLKPKELKKEIAYKDTSFNKLSKEPLNNSSSNPKEPCFITLYLKDEHNRPITNAKIIIKGFKHNEALRVVNLKRRSDEKGKIRFDKEKYFSDCYSFKVKLDEKEAYFSTPLQNAKRIFNNYTHHKEGLVLKFKAKDHLVYDGFNLYHYKGNELINSYMARSGTAKADNEKRSKKQIANYFYQDEKDTSKGKKAYFYYDDESIKDRFGTLPEGEYYLKINEIAKDTNPSFLKDYPFDIGKTWGKYCVRLYSDKECSKTSKEIEIKASNEKENKKSKKDKKEQSIIKDNLYLYSINEKGEFGSSGSIGMAQAQLLEDLSKQAKFILDEKEGIISLRVEYPKQEKSKLDFVKEIEWELDEDEDVVSADKSVRIIVDEKANFAPGTYVECEVDGLKDDANIVWALAQIQNEARLQRILEGKEYLEFKDIKFLKDESKYFHECWEMDDEEKDEEFEKIGFSLPLTRANEEEFDKYYALVFAYEDKNKFKRLPNLNDAYKIIDMSFRVGSGRDDEVKELFTREELKAFNVYNLNRQKSIDSVEEANWFLRANLKNQEKRDFFTYLRTYPQFAGKIAYIYYRFDLVNKEFLTSIAKKDKEIYLQDRDDKYINTIVNKILPSEYKEGKSFKQFHTELLNNKDRDLKECKDFLKALTQTLCKRLNLPLEKVVFYSEKPSGSLSFGAYEDNEVRLNQYVLKAYFKEFAKTVFHECRHFYIEKYYNHNMDALGRYVFYSEKAYINEKIIFDKFSRICIPSENYLVGCNIGATQDAYEIQPNERDPRYVETFIGRSL
ncbi:hypothetical protein OLQ22_04780 [Campylobacter jejuni]|nr:hypothetical protein [Campylobacter jejuni]